MKRSIGRSRFEGLTPGTRVLGLGFRPWETSATELELLMLTRRDRIHDANVTLGLDLNGRNGKTNKSSGSETKVEA